MFTMKKIKNQRKLSPKKRVKMKLISTKGIIMLMIVMTQTNQMKTLLNWMIMRELEGKSKKKGKVWPMLTVKPILVKYPKIKPKM